MGGHHLMDVMDHGSLGVGGGGGARWLDWGWGCWASWDTTSQRMRCTGCTVGVDGPRRFHLAALHCPRGRNTARAELEAPPQTELTH